MINVTTEGTGQRLYQRAKKRIPGGTQLLSKRPEMLLPEYWPSYYQSAVGAEVCDLDGNRYLDMSYNGIGACVLGHADADVNEAVKSAIDHGSMSTLNCPEEVELADLLCELHPWASQVRYARSGGEAMALAVRIARAYSRRSKIAFSGYHGWSDWYLAANLSDEDSLDGHLLPGLDPSGVPRGLRGTALPFRYNELDELYAIAKEHGPDIGVIVMEPIRSQNPDPGFLEGVRQIADELGAVLIFDEITAGFRINTGGSHMSLGVEPDIAVFAKAISNGFPMAAIIGRAGVMQAAQSSFISSTYWTERIGPTAALATIRKHQAKDVSSHLIRAGQRVKAAWQEAAAATGLEIEVSGMDPLAHFALGCENAQAVRTLFTQLMLERGFLATNSFYATFAHQDEQLDAYALAVREAFEVMVRAITKGTVIQELKGPIAHTGFHRLA